MNRTVLTPFSILCLLSIVFRTGLSFGMQTFEAVGTIIIRADGSIEGTTNITTADNVTYTLNATINDSIVVERSNIIIDGAGYTVQGRGGSSTSVGIYLSGVCNVTTKNTNIKEFFCGVHLKSASNNTFSGSKIISNHYGFWLSMSSNNTISGNEITNNGYTGVLLQKSSNNTISENNITNNVAKNNRGVWLSESSNYNAIFGNNITNNSFGVYLRYSSNNRFYHNNLINNTEQVYVETSGHANFWDNGLEGNYWSDYTGVDLDRNGIGDSAYEVDADNIDNYPMMGIFSDFGTTSEYRVQTVCNSSISDFRYNGTAIMFNVTGENDTIGFCRICIPVALMNETYEVFVNGTEVLCNLLPCSNTTHSYLYFTYNHSTQEVVIIPEFPTWTSMLLILIVPTVAILIYRRRLLKRQSH